MIEIRRTIKEDIPSIVDLEKKYLHDTIGSPMLLAELHNKYAYFFTALANEIVVGYIGAWIIEGECEMINFVVDEAYERRGIGTMLFSELVTETKKQNGKFITLEVSVNNIKGQNFYKKQGFYLITKRHNYYKDGTDADVLRKDLG